MKLPRDIELRVRDEIHAFEQEKQMPYVTSYERFAKEEGEAIGEARGEARGEIRGLHDGIALGLKLRFGESGTRLMPEIRKILDLTKLRKIFTSIEQSTDADAVRRMWIDR